MSLVRTAAIVLRKDLLIEWRTRARMNALLFFALATLLLFSFALGPDTKLLRQNAAGYLWLSVLFASVLSLGESFRIESENGSLDGLRLIPTDARAVFLGKALGTAALLIGLVVVLIPFLVAVYDISLLPDPSWIGGPLTAGAVAGHLGKLALIGVLGCLGISGPGTVYSAIASHARARDVLLPLLLFPLLIPALLAAVKATGLVLHGDPMNQLGSWLGLLTAFNLIYWGLGIALFPKVVED